MTAQAPICRDCKHANPVTTVYPLHAHQDYANAKCGRGPRSHVTGAPIRTCGEERYSEGPGNCGPHGKWFAQKPPAWVDWAVAGAIASVVLGTIFFIARWIVFG